MTRLQLQYGLAKGAELRVHAILLRMLLLCHLYCLHFFICNIIYRSLLLIRPKSVRT